MRERNPHPSVGPALGATSFVCAALVDVRRRIRHPTAAL